MLQHQVLVFADLEIHLDEIGAIVVRINEAGHGFFRGMSGASSMSDDERALRVVEVRGFGDHSAAHLGG